MTQTENSRFKEKYRLNYKINDIKSKEINKSPKTKLEELKEKAALERIERKKLQYGINSVIKKDVKWKLTSKGFDSRIDFYDYIEDAIKVEDPKEPLYVANQIEQT